MAENNFDRIVPYLNVHDGQAAIAFYEQAFNGECDMKMDAGGHFGPEHAGKILHAAIKINGGYVMLSDEFDLPSDGSNGETNGTKSPSTLNGTSVTIHIDIEDPKTLWDQAVAAGAEVLMPLTNQFWGEAHGRLRDPFGHVWSIGGPGMK